MSAAPSCRPPRASIAHARAVALDAIDASGSDELDVAVALRPLEERAVHVGPVAHRVGIAEALAEFLAHRDRGDLAFVDRVHHHDALGIDGARSRALADAERIEGRERVGAELDARADLADHGGLLENLYGKALARERERRGKAADAATGDEHRLG